MQSCFKCGQDVVLAQMLDEEWQKLNPGGSVHQCLPQKKLRRVCAWCGDVMAEGDEGAETTHGMCDGCLKRIEAEANNFWIVKGTDSSLPITYNPSPD